MPRLSLWKPEKGNDYKFIDRLVGEHIYAGGTGIFIHKYVGIYDQGEKINEDGTVEKADATQPNYAAKKSSEDIVAETKIQDLLFLENRDRKYDKDVYDMRGVYQPADNDFDLTQFGLFLANDSIFMTLHLNDTMTILGRKIMSGDVLELPHLLDDTGLDNSAGPVRKFYVVDDIIREAAGFDANWWPHLIRVKCQALVDTVEYRDILGDGDEAGDLKHILSTYNNELEISEAVLEQGENEVPKYGFEAGHIYYDAETGKKSVWTADATPPMGTSVVGSGATFPDSAAEGAYYLRTDFTPHRLFLKKGNKWIKVEDDTRQVWRAANTILTTFIENTGSTKDTATGEQVTSKQGLSRAVKPKSDF
jgi:hypothetical protein